VGEGGGDMYLIAPHALSFACTEFAHFAHKDMPFYLQHITSALYKFCKSPKGIEGEKCSIDFCCLECNGRLCVSSSVTDPKYAITDPYLAP